ncbi:hypothetical protein Tcan_00628, partial [Toxocara canis]
MIRLLCLLQGTVYDSYTSAYSNNVLQIIIADCILVVSKVLSVFFSQSLKFTRRVKYVPFTLKATRFIFTFPDATIFLPKFRQWPICGLIFLVLMFVISNWSVLRPHCSICHAAVVMRMVSPYVCSGSHTCANVIMMVGISNDQGG